MEANWQSFITARMVTMSLAVENEMLWEEVRDMRREHMEDRRDFMRDVGEVQKDTRMMEVWMRKIRSVLEKNELEEKSETEWEGKSDRQETEDRSKEAEVQIGMEMEKEKEKEMERTEETEVEMMKETGVMEEVEVTEEKGDGRVRNKSRIIWFFVDFFVCI